MPCILVSIHLNPQPAKHLTVRNQPQDRVNHLAWPHMHHGHHHHAGPLLSSMSHHPSVLNFPHRCSPKLNTDRYFKIMLQLQMLLLTRLLFLKVEFNRNLTMHYTTRKSNMCKRTSISTLRLNYNTSLKQMTSLDALQDYPDWTYWNTFGVYKTCGLLTPGNRILWP